MKAPDKQAPACAVWGVVIVCFTDEELGVDSFWEILSRLLIKTLFLPRKPSRIQQRSFALTCMTRPAQYDPVLHVPLPVHVSCLFLLGCHHCGVCLKLSPAVHIFLTSAALCSWDFQDPARFLADSCDVLKSC